MFSFQGALNQRDLKPPPPLSILHSRTRRQAIECCRVDPTARLARGQILAALEEISVVVSRCMGWSVSKLARDIIREHTAWERWHWLQALLISNSPAGGMHTGDTTPGETEPGQEIRP